MEPKKFRKDIWALEDKISKNKKVTIRGNYNTDKKVFDQILFEGEEDKFNLDIDELRGVLYLLSEDEHKKKLMGLKSSAAAEFDYHVELKTQKALKKGDVISAKLKIQAGEFRLEEILKALISIHGKHKTLELTNKLCNVNTSKKTVPSATV